MRIAHVSTNTLTTDMMGHERYALNLALMEKASGHDIMVITNRPEALWEACHRHDIPVTVEQIMDNPLARDARPALVSQFSDFDPSVINCHTPHAASRAIPAGNQLGVPCVYTVLVSSKNEEDDAGLIVKARGEGNKFTTICICKAMSEALKKLGIPEAEVHYVPAGTLPPPRERAPETSRSRHPNLIYVGALESERGIDLAILAMAELHRRRGTDCPTLNVYHFGEVRELYGEMVEVLRLNDIVRFRGFEANILYRCSASDIMLLSSRWESGPLVVLEAMSRGMPIVASEVGTVSEMLPDRRYGRVVPVNSIVPLADAVESLLDDIAVGLFDPSVVIDRHRSFYTIQKMAERVEAVYLQAVATARGSGGGRPPGQHRGKGCLANANSAGN